MTATGKHKSGQISASVVIPAFNASSKIACALDSLRQQTFQDFEVVIVDDCSDDFGKLEGLTKSTRYDALRIRLERSDRKLYSSGARNRGFELAKGRFVALLDADDGWRPDKLELCVSRLEALDETPDDDWIVHSRSLICRDGQTIKVMPEAPIDPQESMAEYLFGPRGWMQTSTIVLKTEHARQIGFDPELKRHSDYDFCIRAAKMGFKFDLIGEPLVRYNVDPAASVLNKGETLNYVRWWLKRMDPYLNVRDRMTYRAYELPRRIQLERGRLTAGFIFLLNFPFTSWRNQASFVRLLWSKFATPNSNTVLQSDGIDAAF